MQIIPPFLHFRYNIRDELISADEVSYAYGDTMITMAFDRMAVVSGCVW